MNSQTRADNDDDDGVKDLLKQVEKALDSPAQAMPILPVHVVSMVNDGISPQEIVRQSVEGMNMLLRAGYESEVREEISHTMNRELSPRRESLPLVNHVSDENIVHLDPSKEDIDMIDEGLPKVNIFMNMRIGTFINYIVILNSGDGGFQFESNELKIEKIGEYQRKPKENPGRLW